MGVSSDDRAREFVLLFAKHQRTILLYLSSLLPTQTDVDDAFQETSLVLWREFPRFQTGSNFGAWACTIAFNQVRAWRSRQKRETLTFSDKFLESLSEELIGSADQLEQRAIALESCIQSLPEHHRELIRHRYEAGHSIELIAEQAQRSPVSVYRMLSRIREALHDCVSRRLSNETSEGAAL